MILTRLYLYQAPFNIKTDDLIFWLVIDSRDYGCSALPPQWYVSCRVRPIWHSQIFLRNQSHIAKTVHTATDTEAPSSPCFPHATEGEDFQMLPFTQVSILGCEQLTQLLAFPSTFSTRCSWCNFLALHFLLSYNMIQKKEIMSTYKIFSQMYCLRETKIHKQNF